MQEFTDEGDLAVITIEGGETIHACGDCKTDEYLTDVKEYEMTNKLGEKAMEYISDHPLYASTCGITYKQAIAVAEALNPDWQDEMLWAEKFEKMTPEQQRKELKKLEWK